MDGTIVDHSKYTPKSIKKRIQWKLSKERKIVALKSLLENADIKYTFKPATRSKDNILQPYYIRVYGNDARKIFELLDGEKKLPNWLLYSCYNNVKVIFETLEITDGHRSYNRIVWSTTSVWDFNWMCEFCDINNIDYTVCKDRINNGFAKERSKVQKVMTIKYP
jgi:hypothetical protein